MPDIIIENPETGEEQTLRDGQWVTTRQPNPTAWQDVKNIALPSLARGAAQLVGAPGDISDLAGRGIDWAANKALPEGAANAVSSATSFLGTPFKALPRYSGLKDKIEQYTGPLPEAQTTPGKYAQTALEFLPGALAGPGGLIRNAVKGAVGGLTSEAGGQMTEGSSAEPYARMVGALIGSGVKTPSLKKEVPPAQIFESAIPKKPLLFDKGLVDDLTQAKTDYLKASGRAGMPLDPKNQVSLATAQVMHGPTGQPMKSGSVSMGMTSDRYKALRQDMTSNAEALKGKYPREAVAIGQVRDAVDQAMGRHIQATTPAAFAEWDQARKSITGQIKEPSPVWDATKDLFSAGAGAVVGHLFNEPMTGGILGKMLRESIAPVAGALKNNAPKITEYDPKLMGRILATQGPVNFPLQQTPEGYPYQQAP